MKFPSPLRAGALSLPVLVLLLSHASFGQSAPSEFGAETPIPHVSKGIPPRATPGDYLSHVQAGKVSIAAEFDRHDVPTPESTLTTSNYVVVEVAVFGAPGAHATLAASDFSLQINGKKPIPAEQFTVVYPNLRDPAYMAPELEEAKKNKSSGLNAGAGLNNSDSGTPVVHIPPEMARAMALQVQNAALPEGDRALPVDGLLFFKHGGQDKGVHSVQLLYEGSAGKATLTLQP